jgi:hypothetical protein
LKPAGGRRLTQRLVDCSVPGVARASTPAVISVGVGDFGFGAIAVRCPAMPPPERPPCLDQIGHEVLALVPLAGLYETLALNPGTFCILLSSVPV